MLFPDEVFDGRAQRDELRRAFDREVAFPGQVDRDVGGHPARIEASTTTRRPRNTASSTSWVTISTVVCVSVQIRRIRTCMSSLVWTSSAPKGSSSSSTSGSHASARAMATRCFCPPESCLGNDFRR